MRRHGVMILATTVIFVLSASIGVAQTDSNESDEGNFVINVVLPIALAYIMFSLGIGLKASDFSSILDNPKAFAVGLTNQYGIAPHSRIHHFTRTRADRRNGCGIDDSRLLSRRGHVEYYF